MARVMLLLGIGASIATLTACGGDDGRTSTALGADLRPASTTTYTVPRKLPTTAATTTTTPAAATTPAKPASPIAALRPPIVKRFIPFPAKRKRETAAYAKRHYGVSTYELSRPRVIVEHVTVTPDFASVYNTFAPDRPDVELHELPGLCSHFVIDRDGTIYQLVPLSIMCRHTVGLNHVAYGIEHVGRTDQEVLADRRQMQASLRLTQWLRCRAKIGLGNVIGHNESLGSPYHHENVVALRTQTHGDWVPADMRIYRSKLASHGRCPE